MDQLNVNQTQLTASAVLSVTMSTLTDADPSIIASFDSAFLFNQNVSVFDPNTNTTHTYAYGVAQRPTAATNPPSTADSANGLQVVGAVQPTASSTPPVSMGQALYEVVRVHIIAPTLPLNTPFHDVTFNPDASVTDYYFTGNTIERTGDTNTSSTPGMANVTGLSKTSDLTVGMPVTAPGFNQNTTVAEIIDSTSIRVSSAPARL